MALLEKIGDFGKDIRINLSNVFTADGAPSLSSEELWGSALAVAYSLKNQDVLDWVTQQSAGKLTDEIKVAAKGAATLMAMNNVYYRSLHLMENDALSRLPAKLRMQLIANPGVSKTTFELMCLAVSAINGCGQCLTSHASVLANAGRDTLSVQSVLRVAAVLAGAAQAVSISEAS